MVFIGKCEGEIVFPQGENNFGWDPIFKPKGKSQTFADMPAEEKNEISHRGNALKLVKKFLEENHATLMK